ncbi:hypothetical protein L4D76_09745 [Photobacterium sagamiensis]|uniref:hypothetical protein n=1 Tax=Photobacterium sagamiensis TaxID=2910241 RepID=UPI003D0E600C
MRLKHISTLILSVLIAGCNGSSATPANSSNPTLPKQPAAEKEFPAEPNVNSWSNGSESDLVAAARYAGLYAVAERTSDSIELFDVHQNKIAKITVDDLLAVLPAGSNIGGDALGPVGLAFSASGRLLYINVAREKKGSILKFNTNTKALTSFVDYLDLATHPETGNLGLVHNEGELWVGTGNGQILRYQAERNDEVGKMLSSYDLDGKSVRDITIDSADDKGYISTSQSLYRLNTTSSSIEHLIDIEGLKGSSFGRTYGAEDQGGLYLLSEDTPTDDRLLFIPTEQLRQHDSVTPQLYTKIDITSDIAATADGRMLLAGDNSGVMNDNSDQRLSYDEWLRDEYEQYMTYFRTLLWPDGHREGWVVGSDANPDKKRYKTVSTGGAAWTILALITDEVMFERSAEQEIELILTRHAGLHPDGIVPEITVDGLFFTSYESDTGKGIATAASGRKDTASIYTTAKMVHAAIRAKEQYPDNEKIIAAADKIIGQQKNYADYLRSYAQVEQRATIYGPLGRDTLNTAKPYQEAYLFAELAPIFDPMAYWAYEDWWKHRENHRYLRTWLDTEPVIKFNQSSFVELYGHTLFKDRRQSEGWRENFNNFYSHQAAWTDDNNPDYLTAFSAGPTESDGYNADNINDHPGTITHFPAVLGFGMYGDSAPLVGGYMAYRDGRRQRLQGTPDVPGPDGTPGANMLTRYSNDNPLWQMQRIGIPDSVFALFGLAEHLTDSLGNKGIIDRKIARDSTPDDVPAKPGYGFGPFDFESDGELVTIPNASFDNSLEDWEKVQSGFEFYAVTADKSIDGHSAEIRSTKNTLSDFGTLRQTLDLSHLPTPTPLVLRAEGKILMASADDKAYLKIQWDSDNDPNNENVFVPERSNMMNNEHSEVDFELITRKPVGANYIHVSFEVERNLNVAPKYMRYVFDNLTVRRMAIELDDAGSGNWMPTDGSQVSVNISGSDINFTMPIGTPGKDYAEVYRDYILDQNDPLSTRYIVTADATTSHKDGSELTVYTQMFSGNTKVREEGGDAISYSVTDREIHYSGRRLAEDEGIDRLRVIFRFARPDNSSANKDQIATVRNISVIKQDPDL